VGDGPAGPGLIVIARIPARVSLFAVRCLDRSAVNAL